VRRFIGMFAFALWDAGAGKLVLCATGSGSSRSNLARLRELLFGSTLSALLGYPDFPREVDRAAMQY